MTITLMNVGNVDVSKLPRTADAMIKTANKNAVIYQSDMKSEEIISFCKKNMVGLGWKEVEDETAAFHTKEGRFILKFVFNAMACTMVVYKNKDGKMEVTYTTNVRHDLKPDEITAVISGKAMAKPATLKEAFDVLNIMKLPGMEKAEKLKIHEKLYLLPHGTAYQVPAPLEEVTKYYRKLFKDLGWTELTADVE